MKNTILLLLVTTLLVVIVNLLAGLGLLGRAPHANSIPVYEYKALGAEQMDDVGFRAVAAEENIPVSEKGEINFPKELVEKISKGNLLPRSIVEVEKDGGWEFVAVTADNFYLFRRTK